MGVSRVYIDKLLTDPVRSLSQSAPMRRADRLLQLLQILRRHRRPVTAETLAGELEVSLRTIYRDIAGLITDGVPIRGEAGIGYVLGEGYDLPPLMFNPDEVEAVLVGMRWVETRADATLARAARDVIAKVGAVLPGHLRPILFDGTVGTQPVWKPLPEDRISVTGLRRAIREQRKVELRYEDEQSRPTERTIWPIALAYREESRLVVAWCELRGGFRHFRTDRMQTARVLEARYPESRARLVARWQAEELERSQPGKLLSARQQAD